MVTENGKAMLLQLGKLSIPLRRTGLLQAVGMLLGGADGLLAMLPAQGCSHAAQVIRPPPRRRLLFHLECEFLQHFCIRFRPRTHSR